MISPMREKHLAQLEEARLLVERCVRADGEYGGWGGRDLLTHLGAYARLIAAILRAEADGLQSTNAELCGRELTAEERTLAGLDEVNEAIRREYQALSYDEALPLWRTMHANVIVQLARLSDAQLPRFRPKAGRVDLTSRAS